MEEAVSLRLDLAFPNACQVGKIVLKHEKERKNKKDNR
jgi:hypothetical protein